MYNQINTLFLAPVYLPSNLSNLPANLFSFKKKPFTGQLNRCHVFKFLINIFRVSPPCVLAPVSGLQGWFAM